MTVVAQADHRGQLIKTHPRQPPGGRPTDPADHTEEVAGYATRDMETLADSPSISRMLTVTQTARRRGIRLLDWLHKACSIAAIKLERPLRLAV